MARVRKYGARSRSERKMEAEQRNNKEIADKLENIKDDKRN